MKIFGPRGIDKERISILKNKQDYSLLYTMEAYNKLMGGKSTP